MELVRGYWNEKKTFSLIRAVQVVEDQIPGGKKAQRKFTNKKWRKVAEMLSQSKNFGLSDMCRRKFEDLGQIYHSVVDHGGEMPIWFSSGIFKAMTEFIEGTGAIDRSKPKRRIRIARREMRREAKHDTVEMVKNFDSPRSEMSVKTKQLAQDMDEDDDDYQPRDNIVVPDRGQLELVPCTPEGSSEKRSERLAKRNHDSANSRELDEDEHSEQSVNFDAPDKSQLELVHCTPEVFSKRRSERLANRKKRISYTVELDEDELEESEQSAYIGVPHRRQLELVSRSPQVFSLRRSGRVAMKNQHISCTQKLDEGDRSERRVNVHVSNLLERVPGSPDDFCQRSSESFAEKSPQPQTALSEEEGDEDEQNVTSLKIQVALDKPRPVREHCGSKRSNTRRTQPSAKSFTLELANPTLLTPASTHRNERVSSSLLSPRNGKETGGLVNVEHKTVQSMVVLLQQMIDRGRQTVR